MLFNILYPAVLADIKAVDAVVTTLLRAAIADAAAGYNRHIAVVTNKKVVIDHILQPAFLNDDRDVHAFIFGAVLDVNINSGLVRLRNNVNIGSSISAGKLTIRADIISAFRHIMKISHFAQQALLNQVHCHDTAPP